MEEEEEMEEVKVAMGEEEEKEERRCIFRIVNFFLISGPVYKSGSGSEFQMRKLLFMQLNLTSF